MSDKYTLAEINPLNSDHLAKINEALDRLDKADLQGDLAKRAGIKLGDLMAEVSKNRKALEAIKQVYFPGE